MNKVVDIPFFYIFLLTMFLAGFLMSCQICKAEVELEQKEADRLLHSIQQGLIDEWIDLTASLNFSEPEKQADLFLIRNAIQQKELNYTFKELPKEYLKKLVKIGILLVLAPDGRLILEELEKESVKEAKKIAQDWLLQKEIKTSSGKLKYNFTSYKNNNQEALFYYNLAYHPLDNEYGKLIIEFYSPEEIEPKKSTGNVLWLNAACWEFNEWKKQGNEKLKPFIMRVKGEISKTQSRYKWERNLGIEIIYNESMPKFPKEEKPVGFLGKIKISVKKELLKIVQEYKDIFDIFTQIKEKLPKINLFSAGLVEQSLVEEATEKVGREQVSADSAEVEPEPEIDLEEVGREQVSADSEEVDVVQSDESNESVESNISEESVQLEELVQSEEADLSDELGESDESHESEPEPEPQAQPEPEPEPAPAAESEPELCKGVFANPKMFRVLINEVAWMGSKNSSNDEYIELKNIWGIPVHLDGWQLLDKNQQIKIIFNKDDVIPANEFYLLERTDDDTVPGIEANKIYTGALNNTDEALYLLDNNCQLEDMVTANPEWPAGDNSTKKTMERFDVFYWYTFQGSSQNGIWGTPGRENSPAPPIYTRSAAPVLLAQESALPKILITEVQVEGQTSKDEFIELYNPNNESVDLTNWYVQRKTKNGKINSYAPNTLFSGKTIKAKNYFLIANASSTFATSADIATTYSLTKNNTLILKNSDREIVDKVGWGQAQDFETAATTNPCAGESIGRKWATTTQEYQDTDNNSLDFEI